MFFCHATPWLAYKGTAIKGVCVPPAGGWHVFLQSLPSEAFFDHRIRQLAEKAEQLTFIVSVRYSCFYAKLIIIDPKDIKVPAIKIQVFLSGKIIYRIVEIMKS